MSAQDQTSPTPVRTTALSSEDGAGQLRVRVAPPTFGTVLRIMLILAGTGFALYLLWRIRSVTQLLAISLFFAFALFPVVEAMPRRRGLIAGWRSSASTCSWPGWSP